MYDDGVLTWGDVQFISYAFKLGRLKKILGPLSGGQINHNLKIKTSKGKFIVRMMLNMSNVEYMTYSNRILSILEMAGIPVVKPLEYDYNETILYYKECPVQITRFVPYRMFRWSIKEVYSCGRTLRQMHTVLTQAPDGPLPDSSPYKTGQLIYDFPRVFQQIDNNYRNEQATEVLRLHEQIMNRSGGMSGLIPTIIHGDWHPWNMLYKRNGKVRSILDFDTMQHAERLFDIAYMMWVLLQSPYFLGHIFLKGYGPISAQERDLLPFYIAKVSFSFIINAVLHTAHDLDRQITQQKPIIDWVLSPSGTTMIWKMCSHFS